MVTARMIKDALLKKQKKLAEKVQLLLQKSYEPAVDILPSKIRNADHGLITTRPVKKGEPICLYPGVFSAGLPTGVFNPAFGEASVFFMGHLFPPSGMSFEEQNCYIVDITPRFGEIQKVSGYIDGLALAVEVVSPYYPAEGDIYGSSIMEESSVSEDENNKSNISNDTKNSRIEKRRLDENPAACGHFMNHSPTPNSILYSFAWDDVYPQYRPGKWNDESKDTYDLPNIARADGALRYIYHIGSNMTFYPVDELQFQTKDVCGAVICASEDIEVGQEVFRDYELQEPFPQWAKDWYVASPDVDSASSIRSTKADSASTDDEKDDDGEDWRLT